jgi:DNA-binding SARP family transcriptional activator
MEVRVLGSPEVWVGDTQVPLARGKPQILLVALALEAGRVVAAGRLVDAIWGDDPPASALNLIQTYVSALRRGLPDGNDSSAILTRSPGYVLRIDDSRVDVRTFERMVAEGRRAATEGRRADATIALRSALALWRGPAFGGFGHAHLRAETVRLEETRLSVIEERVTLDLEQGLSAELVGELTAMVRQHPLRERLRGQLMTALYRTGRQAESLGVYRQGRETLMEDLGLDPGSELQSLHESILQGDTTVFGQLRSATAQVANPMGDHGTMPQPRANERAADTPAPQVRAQQLPSAIAQLTGRSVELAQVRSVLGRVATHGATPVCSIFGKAGSGKSALAVHAAHSVRLAFPDGQLYASLHDVDRNPVDPAEALGWFLRALGADGSALPESLVERAALFRSMVADLRVLIVLDDAASEQQVRPLLPGASGCAVVVTGRACLSGLDGAEQLGLSTLSEDAGIELLGRIAGVERIAAAWDAAREVVRLCGFLPLAIRAAGARFSACPELPVALLAARLLDERRRLDELSVGDLEIRATVGLSYQALPDDQRAAMRRIALLGAPDFAPWVLAPLLDVSTHAAERLAERLADAQLLDFAGVDGTGQIRYRCHDLLRLYAVERAEAEDAAGDRAAALERLAKCWLWLVRQANRRLLSDIPDLGGRAIDLDGSIPTGLAETLLSDPAVWLAIEQSALRSAVQRASDANLDEVARELAAALDTRVLTHS